MQFSQVMKALWLPASMLLLYLAAVAFRPLLPIDETRYMSVAWEMGLNGGWLAPLTMNFEPYHHKPPMLFWLINLSWSLFGISRWAGLIPVVVASTCVVYLTGILGRKLFPDLLGQTLRTQLIMLASVPFLAYSTIVLFDLTLTVFVLLSLLCILQYSQTRDWKYVVLIGLCMGMGVLTKGPVAYLYVLFPFLAAPLWVKDFSRAPAWYGSIFFALTVSFIPILFWLVPVLQGSDNQFAFWLIWNQTAGRVTGNFSDAHIRSPLFYLPLIPILLLPWLFFPQFWSGAAELRRRLGKTEGVRFLMCWILPVFLSFCLISGKQPHYLVPLVPGIIVALAVCLRELPTRNLAATAVVMVGLIILGQGIAAPGFFKSYDLSPVADYIQAHPERDIAFVRNYHAEIGFLARLERKVDDRQLNQIDQWFAEHPDGLAVIRFKKPEEVARFQKLVAAPYRGKQMGVFQAVKP